MIEEQTGPLLKLMLPLSWLKTVVAHASLLQKFPNNDGDLK